MNTADFNGDGFADLALAEFFDEHSHLQPAVAMSLGAAGNQNNTTANVDLSFSVDGGFPFNFTPPAIGDFNHDGYLDVAFGATFSSDVGGPPFFAQILFGDGNGHFPTAGPALSLNTNFLAAGEDASEKFRSALASFDFEDSTPQQRARDLETVLDVARKRDALTLWHLLARTDASQRVLVYAKLVRFVPPPAGVTKEGILRLDSGMMDGWWNELGFDDIAVWRRWERAWRGTAGAK